MSRIFEINFRTKSQDKKAFKKKAFKMKQKAFCVIFKGLSMKQITQFF